MTRKIAFEPLAPERESEARALVQAVFDAHVAPDFSEQGCVAFRDYLEQLAFSGRAEAAFALTARQGDSLIGVIEVVEGSHVALFFVSSVCQGRGVGGELMRRAVERCIQSDHPPKALTVNSSPNSVGAYAKMGFIASGPEQERDSIRFVPMALPLGDPENPGAA